MLAEMNAKIGEINDMISAEEKAQNEALAEALAKRRAKKNQILEMVEGLTDKK